MGSEMCIRDSSSSWAVLRAQPLPWRRQSGHRTIRTGSNTSIQTSIQVIRTLRSTNMERPKIIRMNTSWTMITAGGLTDPSSDSDFAADFGFRIFSIQT